MATSKDKRIKDIEHRLEFEEPLRVQVIWDEDELRPDDPGVVIVEWPDDKPGKAEFEEQLRSAYGDKSEVSDE